MIEQTQKELADAFRDEPEVWAQAYLEMKNRNIFLSGLLKKITESVPSKVKH